MSNPHIVQLACDIQHDRKQKAAFDREIAKIDSLPDRQRYNALNVGRRQDLISCRAIHADRLERDIDHLIQMAANPNN